MIPSLEYPPVTKSLTVQLSDGGAVSVRRWGPARDRRIILSHGNGLAIDGFWAFGRALLDDFEVVAFDLRNHGQSPRSPQPEMPWPRYIADIPEIFDTIQHQLGARETHGAFHSMSAACTLVAQIRTPRPWASLTLFEPPVAVPCEPQMVAEFNVVQHALAERALVRRRNFNSPDDLKRSFSRAKPFETIAPEAIAQLARATLSQNAEGWELACPAEAEASNFDTAGVLADAWGDLGQVDVPVQIIVGDPATHDMPHLARFGQMTAQKFGFGAVTCPEVNHFMQLQQPELCARLVAAFAKNDSERPHGRNATHSNREPDDETTCGSAISS